MRLISVKRSKLYINIIFLLFNQDFPEVASHQDSLPEFLGFMNQSSQLGTMKGAPSRISISPSANYQNKRHSCPPIPFHLQQQKGSPGGWHHGSPIGKQYSPVHTHKSSPHHHAGNTHHEGNYSFRAWITLKFYFTFFHINISLHIFFGK